MTEGESPGFLESEIGQSISPLAFANDVLGVSLWSKQEEVLNALPDHRRIAVKSGNGLGKGFSAGVAVLWFLYSHLWSLLVGQLTNPDRLRLTT